MSFDPFRNLTSRTIVLPETDIDTDQIIPARFLTTTTREGLGAGVFHDWRFDAEGALKDPRLFREDDRAAHRILVAGDNFGCGSSREHAPWALLDFGFRAVVSTRIADIFKSNALKNGLLPIEVDAQTHAALIEQPGVEITIDLQAETLASPNGGVAATFRTEPFARRCLLDGVDPLGAILLQEDAIAAYEGRYGAGGAA